MASLSLKNICKVYPNGFEAVKDFNLEVEDKEFIIFGGPSGCGKSTTLRMIAGLEEISSGELIIDGKVMNDVEPKDRDIAMVFQNYALYPHMTVYDNMAFSLKLKKTPKAEIDRKVREAAEILDITQYLNRKPKALSGGQRQRLCIARALLKKPKILILDDSTSAVDTKTDQLIRTAFHHEIPDTTKIIIAQRVASVQESDMILVMDHGRIMAAGTHEQLLENCDEYRSIYESQTKNQAQPEELQ